MLKPAQLYKDKLRTELINSWYKPENIYWEGWTGSEVPDIPDNNYDNHYKIRVNSAIERAEKAINNHYFKSVDTILKDRDNVR